jgi:PDZ domain-containing protein
MLGLSRRTVTLLACAVVVVVLVLVAALAPLPISIVEPGLTANVLGANKGTPVISISGVPVRRTSGQLRMVTVAATAPNASVHVADVAKAWFRTDEAAMPRDSVYPSGGSVKEIERENTKEMTDSQQDATAAALKHLKLSPSQVKVTLRLADVGGPSAGLLFTLAVGGVPLKEKAARRDGATVFIVPRDECSDATAQLPGGLKLIPVTTLDGALTALADLRAGRATPSC